MGGGKQALQKVTALEGRVGALESRPITPSANAHVVESWKEGENWYRVWSNGFIEQGGSMTGTTPTGFQPKTVSFYKSYTALPLVFVQVDNTTNKPTANCAQSVTTSKFTTDVLRKTDGVYKRSVWIASGY